MELTWNELKSKLNENTYELLKDVFESEGHQTVFHDLGENFYFITRFLKTEKDQLGMSSVGYLYFEKKLYIFQKDKGSFSWFSDELEKFFDVLGDIYDSNIHILNFYIGEIDKQEDELYERNESPAFMDNWFDLKKDISRIDRYYTRQAMAFNDMVKWMGKNCQEFKVSAHSFVHDVQFCQSNAQGSLGRLDNLHHYYSSIKDDKLNRNIYFLTVLSGIFLPLNLIVGFFGMNTDGLFFKDNPEGTMYVIYALAVILILGLIGTNLFRILNRLVFRRILGRTSLYKRLEKEIIKLEENFYKL